MTDPGIFTRHSDNPVITAAHAAHVSDWRVVKVYNPGSDGRFAVYRTVDETNCSRLMQAESTDGGRTWVNHQPFPLQPDLSNPLQVMGFEDARLVWVTDPRDPEFGIWVLSFAVYDGKNPRQHFATSPDLKNWTMRGSMPPFDIVKHGGWEIDWQAEGPPQRSFVNPLDPHNGAIDRSKSGGMLCLVLYLWVDGKLQRRFGCYFGEGGVWFAHCSLDFDDWRFTAQPVLPTPDGVVAIEAGPPALLREYGWLGMYHYIKPTETGCQYQVGMFVADRDDPSKILWHTSSDQPIMAPAESYEVSVQAVDVIPGARELRAAGDIEGLKKLLERAAASGAMPAVVFMSACWIEIETDTSGKETEILHELHGAQDEVICFGSAPMKKVEARIPNHIRGVADDVHATA